MLLYHQVVDKKTKKKKNEEYTTVFFANTSNLNESGLEKFCQDRFGDNLIKVTIYDISAADFKFENKALKYTITVYLKSKDIKDLETLEVLT